jgi:hypothetical protein
MAKVSDARRREIAAELVEMWEELTPEQQAEMLHLVELMLLRQELNAEILAIQEAAEDGRTLAAPTVH